MYLLARILSTNSLCSLWLIAIGTSGFVFMDKPLPVKFYSMNGKVMAQQGEHQDLR